MQWLPRLAVLTAGIAAALTLASPSSGAGHIDMNRAPADFAQVMGYSPEVATLADGTERLINPNGSCSVPGDGKPFDFTVACQAHDFGYDLLRYADRQGSPVPGGARDEIDRQLTADLHVQCAADASLNTCDATVAVFAAAVGFNTWRQVSGPPVDESGLPRTAGLVLLAGVGGFGAIRLRGAGRARPPLTKGAVPPLTKGAVTLQGAVTLRSPARSRRRRYSSAESAG